MATESTKTPDSDLADDKHDETPEPGRPREPSLDKDKDKDTDEETEDADAPGETEDDFGEVPADAAPAGGFAAGAAAVVSAGLGLCSLTGTALSDMLHSRMELIGRIEASTGGGGDQIAGIYGAPWHTAALVNGFFAFVAVVVGGALLALHARQADARSWVKAVALGGVVLGGIGLLVSGGMYFDLFAGAPELPTPGGGR